MLKNLLIKNFAIIKSCSIDFNKGFIAMIGETGSGKSIIIRALELLIGERSSVSMVRRGSDKTVIEGSFDFPKINTLRLNIPHKKNLVIHREINREGQNLILVNKKKISLKKLKQLGKYLLNISEQFSNQEIFKENEQAKFVNFYQDSEFQKKLNIYYQKFSVYSNLREKFFNRKKSYNLSQNQIISLKSKYKELSRLNLKRNELAHLTYENNLFARNEKVYLLLSKIISNLTDSKKEGVLLSLQSILEGLRSIKTVSGDYQKYFKRVNSNFLDLQDLSYDLNKKLSSLNFDKDKKEEIENRITQIKAFEHKYNRTGNDLFNYANELNQKINNIKEFQKNYKKMKIKFENYRYQLIELAKFLHKKRKIIALFLKKKVQDNLKELMLPNVIFNIRIIQTKKLSDTGFDKIQFWIKTNPGEDFWPIEKILSGGETSRIYLALTNVFVNFIKTPTIVYDEIDTGLSGEASIAIAKKMKTISKKIQLISITHLPQVAAYADYQLYIKKEFKNDHTYTRAVRLKDNKKVLAIAKMIAGNRITKEAKALAKELLLNNS